VLDGVGEGDGLGLGVGLGLGDGLALGEVDAGIVYETDVAAAGDDVVSYPISDYFQPKIRYYAAIVSPGSDAAERYLDKLLGPKGNAALRRAGFLPPA
jgi:molybdate transport system substrate-binding protein